MCISLHTHVYLYIHMYIYTYTCISIHTYIYLYTHIYTCTCTSIHAHTSIYTYICISIYTYIYHIFFAYPSVDGHWICFQVLVFVTSVSMNIGVSWVTSVVPDSMHTMDCICIFLNYRFWFFSRYIPSRNTETYGDSISGFLRNLHTVFRIWIRCWWFW